MAISDTQKVDYLWKKLGYSATKTDTNAQKKAPNEAIPSPLQLRGDKIWTQSGTIPGTQPGSSTSIVTVYPTSTPIECTEDATSTANRTWKTGVTDWISPEFGSTYQVKVYIHTSSDAAGASGGDQVFATGSGNDDEWFFDYQSGVLHFIGTNLPNGVSFSGKSVYIAGSRYTGSIGSGFTADLGDLAITGSPQSTIESTVTNADIGLDPNGTGKVVITGTNAITIPSGTTAQRPSGSTGDIRVNTSTGNLEFYDGSDWQSLDPDAGASSTLDQFTGDGSTTAFTLSASATTNDVIVTIQGVVQKATTAYTVSGTTLTLDEAPATGEQLEVRTISTTFSHGGIITDTDNDTKIQVEESTDEDTIRFDAAGTEVATMTTSTTTVKNDLVVEGAIKSDTFYFVKRSTNTSIAYPGSYGAVTIDYEDAGDDYGSTDAMWDSSTDRFTPTVAGLWYFRASIDAYPGATSEGGIFIQKNGTTVAQNSHIGFIRGQVVTHLYMNGTTDYIQFKSYTQGATTRGQSAENSFFEALLVKQAE